MLAVHPVLLLAARNRVEGVTPRDLVVPVSVSLWIAVLVWLLTGLVTRNAGVRGLATLIWVVWFVWYGVFAAVLAPLPGDPLAYTVALAAAASVALLVKKPRLPGLTTFLNRLSLILLVFLPISFVTAEGGGEGAWEPGDLSAFRAPGSAPDTVPDVYFIILDAYTGERSLEANYGFDNRAFRDSLESLGFFVPARSHGNYTTTFLALAAALNWEYLEHLAERLGEASKDRTIPYRMIENSRTAGLLKSFGYRIVFFPTAYGATAQNRNADLVMTRDARGERASRAEFTVVWLASTPLRAILQWACRLRECAASALPFHPESTDLVVWKFERIADLAFVPGPKFVFAHLLVPHEPYIFDSTCAPKPLQWAELTSAEQDRQARVEYVDQIQCVNTLVLRLVRRLLESSSLPPVIILQSDHGNGRFPFGRPAPIEHAAAAQVAERTDVFGAYHLPGGPGELYDSISPINVLPVVLRRYLDADIPLLEDRTYYSSWAEPYRFTRLR